MNAVLRRNGMASPLSEFLGVCVVLSVLWYGGRLVLGTSYSLNPQQFLGYIGLFYTIINPVKSITTVNYNIKKGKASAERVLEVIQTDQTIKDPVSPKPFHFEESITFDDLNFAYEEQNVLNHLNLTITKGVVEDLAYYGNRSIYRIRSQSGRIIQVSAQNFTRSEQLALEWDDEVYLSWNSSCNVVLTE